MRDNTPVTRAGAAPRPPALPTVVGRQQLQQLQQRPRRTQQVEVSARGGRRQGPRHTGAVRRCE